MPFEVIPSSLRPVSHINYESPRACYAITTHDIAVMFTKRVSMIVNVPCVLGSAGVTGNSFCP